MQLIMTVLLLIVYSIPAFAAVTNEPSGGLVKFECVLFGSDPEPDHGPSVKSHMSQCHAEGEFVPNIPQDLNIHWEDHNVLNIVCADPDSGDAITLYHGIMGIQIMSTSSNSIVNTRFYGKTEFDLPYLEALVLDWNHLKGRTEAAFTYKDKSNTVKVLNGSCDFQK